MIQLQSGLRIGFAVGPLSFYLENRTNLPLRLPVTFAPFTSDLDCQVLIEVRADNPDIKDFTPVFTAKSEQNGFSHYQILKNKTTYLAQTYQETDNQIVSSTLYMPVQSNIWTLFLNTHHQEPLQYPMSELLWLFLANKSSAIILHASAVVLKHNLYIFSGKSGVGKTTISQFFQDEGATLIHDDKIVLYTRDHKIFAGNMPHPTNLHSVQAEGNIRLFFIEHALTNKLTEIPKVISFAYFMANALANWGDRTFLHNQVKIISNLHAQIQAYKLGFVRNKSVVNYITNVF